MRTHSVVLAGSVFLAACGPEAAGPPVRMVAPPLPSASAAPLPGADEPAPTLRLPGDTHPLAEAIELHVDPRTERFSGAVDIDVRLDRPRGVLWLHGKDLHVTAATVTPDGGAALPAAWQERQDYGLASLTLTAAAPAGKARIHVAFDAPFGHGQKGLYKASEAGVEYAFTQFEAIAARLAFPCFDEPSFKIPFTTTLVVPADTQAVANAHEVSRTPEGSSVRVSFAQTQPLPSYLVAFAVGPFDVVPAPDVAPSAARAQPLPLRGVAAKGRGKEMGYALAHTGEILSTLEKYLGVGYPYDKLDILAVPGKGGAMENPGAVTFGEGLLLMDEATAPVRQRRAYASVMAHELAHMWTGDLVTMAWWDDTWLNEAFATWLGNKTADAWDPKIHAGMALLRSVQGAMGADSLVSARAVRQPIASPHDIENAFDTITYQKGGGVLAMFERWAGAEAWQRGLHAYLEAHRFGSATADDFLDAESAATQKDVKTAFHTFLDQPGVPFVEASLQCSPSATSRDRKAQSVGTARVHFKQSRFLPIGSSGDPNRTWQIPICVRAPPLPGPQCTLLTEPEGDLDLGGLDCPKWVFPNADGDGYYRFTLAPADLANLRKSGLAQLSAREKVAYATSLRSAFSRATTPMKDVLEAVAPLARETEPAAAEEPMAYVALAREWLYADPLRASVEAYARGLYAPSAKKLGWTPRKDEDDETRGLRSSVLQFLQVTGRDPAVHAEAKKLGLAYLGIGKDGAIHPEAVDPNLAVVATEAVGEDADRATWDAMKALLAKSVDETVRGRLLWAMAVAKNPELAAAARELTLDPSLRDSEVLTPLRAQLGEMETREVAWAWLKEHYDAILARLPRHHGGVALVSFGRFACDEAHARDVEAFFTPKIESIEGGPRTLASTLEDVRLCAAKRQAQEPSARELFARKR
ncbi:MAG TPA: M1 family metallopeptidase [Polyangiaceae bacterium]